MKLVISDKLGFDRGMEYAPFLWEKLKENPIIGVDEVGRGCLAGPVFAAAVIIDPTKNISSFTDSKKLSASRREELAEIIKVEHQVGIGFATVEEIEELNILWASILAMKRAVEEIKPGLSAHILVDGNQKIRGLEKYKQTTIIKGDLRATPIAAASIVAKVTRDKLLREMSKEFPDYGFEKHKGYSTAIHKAAIKKFGATKVHRRSFAGVREYVEQKQGVLL